MGLAPALGEQLKFAPMVVTTTRVAAGAVWMWCGDACVAKTGASITPRFLLDPITQYADVALFLRTVNVPEKYTVAPCGCQRWVARPIAHARRIHKPCHLGQGCCKIGKMTRACGSAEGDSPLPEREVSSLHPSFPPPQAAKREFATALPT
jgi:hypothetical protein